MYALFLESKAAREVRDYVIHHPEIELEELLQRTYLRGQQAMAGDGWTPKVDDFTPEEVKEYEDWWVSGCLRDDAHVRYDVDMLFCWGETPEGGDFWEEVSRRDDADFP